MVEFSVCIEMLWRDLPMHERVRRVKKLGFKAFEFWGWKNKDLDSLRAAQQETGLALAAMSAESSWLVTERGSDKEVVDLLVQSLAVARSFGCTRLICVPGIGLGDETWETTRRRVLRRLKMMAETAKDSGVILMLEPLNPIVDHKGAWLTRLGEAADLVQESGSPDVAILCDLYHQQITEGNLLANLAHYGAFVRHYHAAGVPDRHELLGGELDYRSIFAAIKASGYNGYLGLEFSPSGDDDQALKQAMSLL